MDHTINDELDYICKLTQTNTGMNIFIKTSNNLIKEYKFPYLENPFSLQKTYANNFLPKMKQLLKYRS